MEYWSDEKRSMTPITTRPLLYPGIYRHMAVLTALRLAAIALGRNPILFVVAGLSATLQLPQLAAQALGPLASAVVSMVFNLGFIVVFPFVQGGLIAMANEAFGGRTTAETFVSGGKANYVQLLIGYVVLVAANMVIAIGALVLLLVVGGVLFVLTPDPTGALLPGVLVLFVLLFVLVYLLFVFFVQFYGHAIVIDDLEALDGFKRSVRVVRDNPVSTVGYSLLLAFLTGGFALAVGGVSTLIVLQVEQIPEVPDLPVALLAGLVLVGLVGMAVVTALLLTFSVAFYRTVSEEGTVDSDPAG